MSTKVVKAPKKVHQGRPTTGLNKKDRITGNPSDFSIVNEFLGYRNREDQTNLPPGYLVQGSQNVLVNPAGRISVRKGYTLYGQSGRSTLTSILGSYDDKMSNGTEVHLRCGNNKVQYPYTAAAGDVWSGNTFTAGQVFWIDLITGTSSDKWNFTNFFDTTENKNVFLGVNGDKQVTEWNGAVTTAASYTATTITKNGSATWAVSGFYVTKTGRAVVINGNTYTYTGGEGTTTLTGVSPSPVAEPVNSVVHQKPVVTLNTSFTSGPPTTFTNDLISNLRNQIYLGSLTSNQVFISKTADYTNYAFTSPVRLPGEGAQASLQGSTTAFAPQEDTMYISAGLDRWYQIKYTLSADNSKEDLSSVLLKTSPLQAARSQAAVAKIKNSVMFLNNETTLDELGRVEGIFGTPQASNISDPIRIDMDSYDFTNASVAYYRNFVYIAVPVHGLVRAYNLATGMWEAPMILPISRFAIIGGQLYGHSYSVLETYQLFTGYNDNGNSISANATFSFQQFGERAKTKYFNEAYAEGYITSNTTLAYGIKYDIDGCATVTSYNISGADSQIVCITSSSSNTSFNSPLGQESLGKNPLGGEASTLAAGALPPKFRVIQTFPKTDFYECQISFSSNQIDAQWELIAYGVQVQNSVFGQNAIKK